MACEGLSLSVCLSASPLLLQDSAEPDKCDWLLGSVGISECAPAASSSENTLCNDATRSYFLPCLFICALD